MIVRKNLPASQLYPELASYAKSVGERLLTLQNSSRTFFLLREPLHLNKAGAIRDTQEAQNQLRIIQKCFINSLINKKIDKS